MKTSTAIVSVIGVFVFICILWASLIYIDSKSEQMDKEWREFQSQHHCRIKESSFWKGDVWTCDGFDIKHN